MKMKEKEREKNVRSFLVKKAFKAMTFWHDEDVWGWEEANWVDVEI